MKTYIINLPERPERLAQAKQELERVNIMDYEVFPAIKCSNGVTGIYLTLYKLIEQSYLAGLSRIRIFEDDVLFTGDASLIANIESILPERFDIFYYGCNTHDPSEGRQPLLKNYFRYQDLFTVSDAYGCHAMIISYAGMGYILRAINNYAKYEVDCQQKIAAKLMEVVIPIDVLIQREIQSQLSCFCYKDILATQRNGYSDIEGKEMNQDYIVDRFNANKKILLNN